MNPDNTNEPNPVTVQQPEVFVSGPEAINTTAPMPEVEIEPSTKLRTYQKITMAALIALFVSPLLGTIVVGIQQSSFSLWPLQLIVMGIYAVPFTLVALVCFSIGKKAIEKNKFKTVVTLFTVSILACLGGIVLMLAWLLETAKQV